MIIINGHPVRYEVFPNKELFFKYQFDENLNKDKNIIQFDFIDNSSFIELYFVKKCLDENKIFRNAENSLYIPYLPYSRMDRRILGHAFTLKYICEFINDMRFDNIYVNDCHSDVGTALLNNCTEISFIDKIIDENFKGKEKKITIVYPDVGAAKRYRLYDDRFKFITASKNRDTSNGIINSIEVLQKPLKKFENDICIIIDDIISYGNTFIKVANKLKDFKFSKIYLIVSHIEKSSVLKNIKEIKKALNGIYTTNSLSKNFDEKELKDFIMVKNIGYYDIYDIIYPEINKEMDDDE